MCEDLCHCFECICLFKCVWAFFNKKKPINGLDLELKYEQVENGEKKMVENVDIDIIIIEHRNHPTKCSSNFT